ncbi:MAG: hypothetical protein F6J95_032205 [Leptolyngbya sp. SIO1E4]|nr:hypothetical protein [Leptolyngbya sp. SIO1E4]
MARITSSVLDHSQPRNSRSYGQPKLTLQEAQEEIFNFLLSIVRQWPVENVLSQFQHMFFEHGETASSEVSSAIYILLFSNNEQEFHNTLKRSCYILVNNWEVARQYKAIQALVERFDDPILLRHTLSPTIKRLREWMLNFIDSQDYRELQLFAARFSEEAKQTQWSSRYTSYLLVPQYINAENPVEQREAARTLSRRLKNKFKFDLAMYTAHSQNTLPHRRKLTNPTALGDSALRLIKAIVARRGRFSYKNLAHLFLEQVKDLNYVVFKRSLVEYLIYSVNQPEVVKALRQHLGAKLDVLYTEYDAEAFDASLRLRTCNRVIDYLMTEDQRSPSPLFTLLLSQGSSISLAILLLKLVLISRNSHHYLEARIADLIRYYEQFPRDQCLWVINFLEVFQVTFAIYAENVEYNLIAPGELQSNEMMRNPNYWTLEDLEACRIFSRMVLGKDDGVRFQAGHPNEGYGLG